MTEWELNNRAYMPLFIYNEIVQRSKEAPGLSAEEAKARFNLDAISEKETARFGAILEEDMMDLEE
jgi:hypothetical protein